MPKEQIAKPAIPMYSCGVCNAKIGSARAEKSGGYCELHEFMRTNEVLDLLVIQRSTLDRMAARGELKKIRPTQRIVLWRRAEITHLYEKMKRDGRGWIGMLHRQTN